MKICEKFKNLNCKNLKNFEKCSVILSGVR